MITLFSVPKPFCGHIGLIQKNAINSWKEAFPGCQIILFGDETRQEEIAELLDIEVEGELLLSPLGAPLLNHVFARATERSRNHILCFVNTDIIFTMNPTPLIALPLSFLMIGESFEIDLREDINFMDGKWRENLPRERHSRGPFALDYFFFSKGLFQELPPFRIGRARYDNWLIYQAMKERANIINGSLMLGALHQKHNYSHLTGGRSEAYRGMDAKYNEALAGWWCKVYLHSIYDAGIIWNSSGLHRRQQRLRFLKQLKYRVTKRIEEHMEEHGGMPKC